MADSVAKLARCDSDDAQKRAPHSVSTPKPTGGRDLFKAAIRPFQLVTGCFDAYLQDKFRGRPAHLTYKYALKIPNAHGGAIRQNLH